MNVIEFHLAMMQYCVVTAASETSARRTIKHNLALGGVAHSAHLVFLARDVTYDVDLPLEYRQEYASRLGLTLIPEDDHDHLQPADWKKG